MVKLTSKNLRKIARLSKQTENSTRQWKASSDIIFNLFKLKLDVFNPPDKLADLFQVFNYNPVDMTWQWNTNIDKKKIQREVAGKLADILSVLRKVKHLKHILILSSVLSTLK